jgi:hypothetical protein
MNRDRVLSIMLVGYGIAGLLFVGLCAISENQGQQSNPVMHVHPSVLLATGILFGAISSVGWVLRGFMKEQAARIADLERRLSAAPGAATPAGLPAHSPQAPHDPSVPP